MIKHQVEQLCANVAPHLTSALRSHHNSCVLLLSGPETCLMCCRVILSAPYNRPQL